MLSPLVPLSELARRTVGDPTGIDPASPDGVRAAAALEDASWLARDAAGRTRDGDWPTEADVPYPVRTVVLRAARRGWENPEATTSESVTASGVSSSREAEPNAVYLTEDERRDCARFAPGAGGGGGLISLGMTRGEGGSPATIRVPGDRPDASPVAWLASDDYAAPDGG